MPSKEIKTLVAELAVWQPDPPQPVLLTPVLPPEFDVKVMSPVPAARI